LSSTRNNNNNNNLFVSEEIMKRGVLAGEGKFILHAAEERENSNVHPCQNGFLDLNNDEYKKSDSMADTETTLTATSRDSSSDSQSKDSHGRFSQTSTKKSTKSAQCLYEEFDSLSYDYHSNFFSSQSAVSGTERRDNMGDDLPPVPRRPISTLRARLSESHSQSNSSLYDRKVTKSGDCRSPYYTNRTRSNSFSGYTPNHRSPWTIYSRLSSLPTKSLSLRREQTVHKPRDFRAPFYTTVGKANSFSDSTLSSVSTYTYNKSFASGKVSPSFHSRLAVSETFSSAMRKQKSRDDFNNLKQKKNRVPFYTTVSASKPNEQGLPPKMLSQHGRRKSLPGRREMFNNSPLRVRHLNSKSTLSKFQNVAGERTITPSRNQRKKTPKTSTNVSIYDRLSKQGTVSSLQRNRNSVQYKEETKTLHEHWKAISMRDFEGSTYVPVTKGCIKKSVIGSVINCS